MPRRTRSASIPADPYRWGRRRRSRSRASARSSGSGSGESFASAAKLAERARQEREAELNQLAGDQREVAWGSQIRSYVMHPYQQVKDLRSGLEVGNVEAVLDGDVDQFMEAYLRWAREQGQAGVGDTESA